jgi:hypothetical protein
LFSIDKGRFKTKYIYIYISSLWPRLFSMKECVVLEGRVFYMLEPAPLNARAFG